MIVVRTRVLPDAHGGLGLFADEPVAAGAVVWQYDPAVDRAFSIEEAAAFHPAFRAFMDVYGYPVYDRAPDGRALRLTGYGLNTDNARFINHSDEPNLLDVERGDARGPLVAARDIPAGEELTIDYRVFDLDGSIYREHPDFLKPR